MRNKSNVQSALQIAEFWALAFITLCAALALLNIFSALIENDLELLGLGKETAIAAVAALIEGASVWAVATFIPFAVRALFIPALAVAVIYKVAHFEDRSRYEIIALLLFQSVIVAIATFLFLGHFATALGILLLFAVCLTVTIVFMRGLS